MPTVPYSPVPSVAPSSQGVSGLNVRVVADAFGAGIADETRKLGGALEKAGDEIFTRAISLQQQMNDAEAKEADAQYIIRSGDLFEKYRSLQGQDAVNARPQFIKDLEGVRQEIRNGMKNDASRRIYDGTTRQNFARTVFATASHAGDQARKYVKQAGEAQDAANFEQTLRNPNLPGALEQGIATARENAINEGRRNGLPPQAIKNNEFEAESKLRAARIVGLARSEPFKAFDVLEAEKDKLTHKDREHAERIVIDGKRTTRARMVSEEVLFGVDPEKPQKTLEEAQEEALAKVEPYLESDPMLKDAVKDRVWTDWNKMRGIRTETRKMVDDWSAGLTSGLNTPDNVLPTTVEELTVTQDGKAMWDRATDPQKKKIMNDLKRNADDKIRVTNHREALRLQGLSQIDPVAFLSETPASNPKLSPADQRKFLKLQQTLTNKVEMDPRVRQALSVLGPDLRSAGITSDNKENYSQFVGALQDAIMQEQGDAKRPLKPEEYRKIGARLMQNRDDGGWFSKHRMEGKANTFFPGGSPLYQVQVPDAEQAKIKDAWVKKFGGEPNEGQIQRAFVAKTYQDLYGKKLAPKDESRVGQPKPPQAQ